MREQVVDDVISEYIPPQTIEDQWDVDGLQQALAAEFNSNQPIAQWLKDEDDLAEDALRERIIARVGEEYAAKEAEWIAAGIDMRQVEKQLTLQVLDQKWKEHLAIMDHLRQGIHLRAYAQKQPKQEYKRESFGLFQELQGNINRDVVRLLSRIRIERDSDIEEAERRRRLAANRQMNYSHADGDNPAAGQRGNGQRGGERAATFVRGERKVGRNERCPCGSGKKYKHCCGAAA